MKGIDVSAHQGNINWDAVKASGIEFAIIRISYGQSSVDSKAIRNIEECIRVGMPFGVYTYSYALNTEHAKNEANLVVRTLAPYKDKVRFPVIIDMEDADSYKRRNGMPSKATLTDICITECEIFENAGYYAAIYANLNWFRNKLDTSRLVAYDKWLAQWSSKPTWDQPFGLWQYTSSGKVNGISGNVDMNESYKDYPSIIAGMSGSSEVIPEPPKPEPAPVSAKYHIGDTVIINGALYTNANATTPAGSVSNKRTTITRYVEGAAHPYNTTGDLGWMNESDISPVSQTSNDILKGDKVRMNGTKDYNGNTLASWVKGSIFDVIEVSVDRVVIGKGNAVTAAVKINDLTKI